MSLLDVVERYHSECSVQIDCILSDMTESEELEIKELWRDKKATLNFLRLDNWGGSFEVPDEFGEKRTPEWDKLTTGALPLRFVMANISNFSRRQGNFLLS